MTQSSRIFQIVDGSGCISGADAVDGFFSSISMDHCSNDDYNIVAIMGPQSSGKSTLMNTVFGTTFDEMDALSGRQQTTHGVWLSGSPKLAGQNAPLTLVMDLEGSDGRERGEDDTSFERQSALFALATSDILMINMWAKDVGRETGAGKPLLKTIFQVNLKLFHPTADAKKTVLMFVFRDRTKTPLEKLKETWEADLQDMWAGLAKPAEYEASRLQDFFELQYAALSNYEDRPEDFAAESIVLRKRFTRDAPEDESLLREGRVGKLPGQALALSMVKAWEVIKENKDLNLPAHRVMVATIRCKEIARQQVAAFEADERWVGVVREAGCGLVGTFGGTVATVIRDALDGYDEEARYFDAKVSSDRRTALVEELCAMALPVYEHQLVLARADALRGFVSGMKGVEGLAFTETALSGVEAALKVFDGIVNEALFVPGTPWENETTAARAMLDGELKIHVEELNSAFVKKLSKKICEDAEEQVAAAALPLLETPPKDLWIQLQKLVERVQADCRSVFDTGVAGYAVGKDELAAWHTRIDDAVTSAVNKMGKEAANTILPRMKDVFSETFHKDGDGMPRNWTPSVDISRIAKESKRAAAQILGQFSVLAYLCADSDVQAIHEAIDAFVACDEKTKQAKPSASKIDIRTTPAWPNVDTRNVLLTPSQVRSAWRQFSSDVALSVQQAVATQEANRLARNRMPPVWAIVAMFVLGFNELVSVLRNPLWLLTILVLLAFARTVYEELDVEGEMQNGLLPGIMVLSGKFVPTMRKVVRRTIDAGKKILEGPPEGASEAVDESPGPVGVVRSARTGGIMGRTAEDEGIRRRLVHAQKSQEDTGSATAATEPMDIDSSRSVSFKDD